MASAPSVVQPRVLWWGRHDPSYSRNAVVRDCFEALGWRVRDFRPAISALGVAQARLAGVDSPDLVWVPCFRQRDIADAARFARRHAVPIVADPLISAYDKQVDERRKFAPTSVRGRRLLAWESALLGRMDRVTVDTPAHAEYFNRVLGVDPSRLFVVPVGADETMFVPAPLPSRADGIEALFYGSFLPLQGADTIVRAARLLKRRDVRITLLGSGPTHKECMRLAEGVPRLHFEPWIDYRLVPGRIHRAHCCLGVFGATPKAGRVIPNKVYQSLASGRAVITRASAAYPAGLREVSDDAMRFVEGGDAGALAAGIDDLAGMELDGMHIKARALFDRHFSQASIAASLAALLKSLGLPAG